MANKKFKKPLLLQEEFTAGEISKPGQTTAPAVKTDSTTVGTQQTSAKSGEEVRAEIVQDVDTILTNLEQLSKQITESIDAIIEEVFNEDVNLELNENAGATLMAMFKAGAAAAKLNSMYPKLYKKKKTAELDKTIFGYKFDQNKEERLAQAEDKIKDKLNDAIDKLDNPAAKKKARLVRDAKLAAMKEQAGKKLDREKADQATKQDRLVADFGTKISKLISDNKVSDSPAIAAQWDLKKLKIERDTDDEFLKKTRKVQDEFIEDEDRQKRLDKAAEERTNKDIKAQAEASKKAQEKAAKAASDLEAEIANTTGDEAAALQKIQAYMKGISEFGAATGALAADPQNKDLAKEAKTKLSELKAAYGAIGKKDYSLAFGYEGDSKEADVLAAKDEYSDRIDTMESTYDEIDAVESEAEKTSKQLADAFIAGNEGFKVIAAEEKGKTVPVANPQTGEDEQKPKYEGEQDFTGKKEDGSDDDVVTVAKEISYSETASAKTGGGTNLEEGRKTVDSSAFGDDKLGYNDQFRGNTSLSQSLASELGFDPKKPWSEGLGFDDQAMYSVGKPEGTIANDALSGKYTYAELLAMAKDHFGIKESEEIEEIEEGNEFGAARAEAIAKGEKTFKVGDEEYPVEDVSKDDKENAEEFVEEAKVELPKKVKLYEGMSVADKFKALM
jgi:hypothetical protein